MKVSTVSRVAQHLDRELVLVEMASLCRLAVPRGRMTLALYRSLDLRKKVCPSAALWRAFDIAVRRKPPVVAADAGPMQIQLWEGAVPRFAGTVRESTAANTEGEKGEVDSEFLRSGRSRKWKEAICRRARHTETAHADVRKSFVL